jgi:hypothetical protein
MGTQKVKTQALIEDGLKDQIADFDRKDRLLQGARKDLEDKLDHLRDTMRKRDDELAELRGVLADKARQGHGLED